VVLEEEVPSDADLLDTMKRLATKANVAEPGVVLCGDDVITLSPTSPKMVVGNTPLSAEVTVRDFNQEIGMLVQQFREELQQQARTLESELQKQAQTLEEKLQQQAQHAQMLEEKLQQQAQRVEILSFPTILLCGSQIVDVAVLGKKPYDSSSWKFRNLVGAKKHNLALLALLLGKTEQELANRADKLGDFRNTSIAHVSSVKDLDKLVRECNELITPEIRKKHRVSSVIGLSIQLVDKYAQIKKAFPSNGFN
jgi:hypothetical protein